MSLSERQLTRYTDVVDLHSPIEIGGLALLNNEINSLRYSSTPDFACVNCCRVTAPEFATGEFYGKRLRQNTTSLLDEFHFPLDQVIGVNWVIRFLVENHPDYGKFYQVEGDPEPKHWRANKLIVKVKTITRPTFV